MKVKVMNRTYKMGQTEFEGLLKIASEQVPFGIYAVEKKGYAELRCDHCKSIIQLKQQTQNLKRQGFKVYSNGR